MNDKPSILKALMVEDNPDDAKLVLRELKRAGFEVISERVETEAAFRERLRGDYDLILSDYSMPDFDGLRALKLLKESGRDIPFIIVSGSIGEETAVEAMRLGVDDYLLKDRTGRLGAAVKRALEQARLRSERKLAEQQISLQASALEAAANAIVIVDTGGKIVSANTGFCVMTGYSREELVGQNPRILKSGQQSPEFYRAMWDTVLSGQVWRGELTNRRKDGTIYHEEMTITPVRSESGEIVRFIAVKQDITEQKRAEAMIRQSSGREMIQGKSRMLRELAMVLFFSALVFVVLKSTNVLQAPVNALLKNAELFDEAIGTLAALVLGFAVLAYRRWKEAQAEMRQQWRLQEALRLLHSELETRVQQRTVQLATANEALRTEVEGRIRAAEALRESERRFREMLEKVELIAMTLDKNGVVTFCNDHLLQLTGWKREEVMGRDWFSTFLPATETKLKKLFFDTVETGELPHHLENEIKTRSGEIRDIVWNNTMLRDAAGKCIGTASIGEDVTDRKRTLAALLASEEKFRQLAESMNEVAWIVAADRSAVLYISPSYEKVWGRTCRSLYGSPISFHEAVHVEDRAATMKALAALERGEKYDLEFRIVRPDRQIRWVHSRGTAIRNPAGEIYRVAGISEDITSVKQAQEELRDQLLELQRWHEAMLGREERILELKQEVNHVLARQHQSMRYSQSAMS